MMGTGGMMGQPGSMMSSGWLPPLSWLLVTVGLALLLVWAARRVGDRGGRAEGERPLATLQRRYARGEIGAAEYERIRSDLVRDSADR